MRICILCEESKVAQVREKMNNQNILLMNLSPSGSLPATHKFCTMVLPEDKGREMINMAEITINEESHPNDFLNKYGLKLIK